MQRLTEQIQKISAVMIVLIAVLTGLNYCVSRARLAQVANAPTKTTLDQAAYILAKRDKATELQPYVDALTKLTTRCTENHEVLAGMASTLVKRWNANSQEINHLQGMEILVDELGDKPRSPCTDDALRYVEGLR